MTFKLNNPTFTVILIYCHETHVVILSTSLTDKMESTDFVTQNTASIYSVLWVFEAVATATFFLRILSRSLVTRDIGLEDALMTVGYVSPYFF
jgi:hypothetical protein